MTFTNAITSGFRNALVFSGRARRPEYWWFFLFVFAGDFALRLIGMALGAGGVLSALFWLAVFVPFLSLAWRRLQDTGRPGWYVLVPSALVVVSALVSGSMMRAMMQGMGPGMMAQAPIGPMGPGMPGPLILLLAVAQLVAGLVIVWWMSRPSQRGTNAYGPEPRVR